MARQTTALARTVATSAGRPLADLVIGHPVGTATLVATRLLGWPVRRGLIAAAVVDQALPAVTARSSMAPARFLHLWVHASRFRRRWPYSLQRARTVMEREVAVDRSGSRLGPRRPNRPVGNTVPRPPLALLPHRIDGTTVAWAIDLDHADDRHRLDDDLAGLSLTDPRVLSAEIERRATPANPGFDAVTDRWEVVVDFDIEPPPLSLSVLDREAFADMTDDRPGTHHPHEEGSLHGNG